MVLGKEYLEGLECEDALFVRCIDDRVGSGFYSYMFTGLSEYSEDASPVLVYHAKLNSKNSGLPDKYNYILTVSDMDGGNSRCIGATEMHCNHYKYIGDNIVITVDLETWKQEGRDA